MILIKHISKTPLVTSRHLPKSYPILTPNQPRILLELPSFVPKHVPTFHPKILDSLRCAPTTGLGGELAHLHEHYECMKATLRSHGVEAFK